MLSAKYLPFCSGFHVLTQPANSLQLPVESVLLFGHQKLEALDITGHHLCRFRGKNIGTSDQ